MKGLVFHGPRDIRCDTVPDPTPPDNRGAVVRVERAAICGSDLHFYHGDMPVPPGFTIGHEFVGEIMETGSGVSDMRVGDRVMVSAVVACGQCTECLRGTVTQCLQQPPAVFGCGVLPGGQAEAVAVPTADHACERIPDGISVEQAVVLTDILPTGFFGARNANIQPGQTVVIIGMGPVGMMALMSAQLFGPARILAVDRVPERVAIANGLGAEGVLATSDAAVHAAVLEATSGRGADAVIEAVGADEAILLACQLTRPGGVVSVVGVNINPTFPFNMATAFFKNLTFRIGLVAVQEMWQSLVPLVAAGTLSPESVFTHRMGLSEGSRAYEIFDARQDGILKVLLDPSA